MLAGRPRSTLVAVLLAGLAFSGCMGGKELPPGALEAPDAPRFSSSTGAVAGKVLTEEFVPVVNASVGLGVDGTFAAQARTGSDGGYALNDIRPGTYLLHVSAVCCDGQSETVNVEAGKVTEIDIVLGSFFDADAPYVEAFIWDGFLSCGAGLLATAVSLCSFDSSDSNFMDWTMGPGVEAIVVGVEWAATAALAGRRLSITLDEICHDGLGGSGGGGQACYRHAAHVGTSPLVFTVESPEDEWSFANTEDQRKLVFRVFPANDPGVVWQQRFTLHYHLFFNHAPPEEYHPVPDA